MIDIKKILCPVDFFPASEKALQYAAGLAEDYGAKMHLLHVVTLLLPVAQEYPIGAVAVMQSVEEAATAHMKKLVQNLQRRRIEVTSKVVTGDVHLLIEQAIATEQPDIIVMGSHPRSGVERLFIGSMAEWLMRNSPVPILVISEKQRVSVQQPRRVA
jgi:nucleotide-binding universal stress UspA family protein